MAWTYILRCADDSFYVGSTVDLARRLAEHDAGLGAAYTRPRRRRPVQLAWACEVASIEDAYLFEKRVQNWSRAKREALINRDYDSLPGLAKKDFTRRREQEAAEAETDE
jgi:putative endonuclease